MLNSSSLMLAAGDLAETARGVAEKFGFDLPHFIAQCISFLIVAGALYKFAYKPVLGVLEERRKRIADGLANADRTKRELANAQAKAQEIVNQASTQANHMIEEARAAAQRVGELEKQKSIAEAADIIAKARDAATSERARMLTELRREVGQLVVRTTSKVTGKVLTNEDQQRLAEEANRTLAA